jgi:hypothetical protein
VSETTGKETFKTLGYVMTLDKVYSFLLDKEINEDLTIVNNISKVTSMINELKEFTIKYIEDNK